MRESEYFLSWLQPSTAHWTETGGARKEDLDKNKTLSQ